MANGFYCKKCGYQETHHDFPEEADNPEKVCGNFRLYASDKKEQLKIEEAKLERANKMHQQKTFMMFMDGSIIDIGN